MELTVVDVFFWNENDLFLKCCPGIINSCLNSYRLKISTPQMPKRAERACERATEQVQEKENPHFEQNVEKTNQLVKKMSFF